MTEASSDEWQTYIPKKIKCCSAAKIGQIAGVTAVNSENSNYFFFHPYIKSMQENIFLKEKLLVRSVYK